MIPEPFGQPRELFRTFLAAAVTVFPRGALRSSPSERTSFGTCEGNEGKRTRHAVTAYVTVNRHEELSERSAPYADFGHGSLFEAAPGARGFPGTAESPTKFHFMPVEMRKHGGGLHAHFNRRQASPSGAASGLKKTSGSGQAPSWRDLGVQLYAVDPLH